MEPRLPTPAPSSEMDGYQRQEAFSKPEQQLGQAEAIQRGSERHETLQQHAAPDSAPVAPPQPPPVSPALPAVSQIQQPATPFDDSPLIAADEDLIEKEWVDKAKKIVNETKLDPYKQENQVSKLQADYLKKRYGKNIKLVSE